MRTPTILACLFLVCSSACKQDQSVQAEDQPVDSQVLTEQPVVSEPELTYSVWNTAPNPESVSIDGGVVYVTHFGDELAPTKKDGNGYIAVYDANGTLVDTLITGLHAPKGTVIQGKMLYVADVDRIIGINTASGKQVIEVSFTGKSSFLNGLTKGVLDVLYVSGTDVGKIWKVIPRSQTVEEVADLPGVNGLAYDAKRRGIYAVQYLQDNPADGRVYLVDAETGKMRTEGDYSGLLDGAVLQGGTFYFTDWGGDGSGKVLGLDVKSRETRVIASDPLFSGPANFAMLGDGLALIPMLTGSKVVAVPLQQ